MIRSLDLSALAALYAAKSVTATDVAREVLARVKAAGDDHVWISRVSDTALFDRANELSRLAPEERAKLPLFGIPFAVKDNIDVAGLPTTAACPDFAYKPTRSATCVERLEAAGAMLIGKTNLDQFATGLVGVRSPYGVPRNPIDARYVPGGSSSGSAVAVSSGLVSFALGTDTAGSGRVPAGLNNIVGLKPTRGLISAAGVLPACRTLDCVSVFALTADDAHAVLQAAGGLDERDSFSREAKPGPVARPETFRFALPRPDQRAFFGDNAAKAAFEADIERLITMGGTPVLIDYAPFLATAKLLYEGPWVAERYTVVRQLIESKPEALHPVTLQIISGGASYQAADAFESFYRLEELRAETRRILAGIDIMVVPTSGTVYTVAELEADPIRLNSNLGYYTNFVNFLDYSALAVPSGFRPNGGMPHGITLIAPAWSEGLLTAFGAEFHQQIGGKMGATGIDLPPRSKAAIAAPANTIDVVIVGAHLTGQPLNPQLTDIGASFRRVCRTAASYRLYALPGMPARPGLIRVPGGGCAIEAEIWAVPADKLGGFLTGIAAPLGLGKVMLEDGSTATGFICEPIGIADATEITSFGGWRAYRARSSAA